MEWNAHTWITGKRLGSVIAEDNGDRVLFCLPRHPGNVLDAVKLGDLKKEKEAAVHYLEWTRLEQQEDLIAILRGFAESAIVA